MAILKDSQNKTTILRAHHLIGRSRSMHTTLHERDVSAQHAAILWGGDGWKLRDLGSRNGTTLDGQRLEPGETLALTEGAELTFGSEQQRFTLISDAPPAPTATCGDRVLEGSGDYLALPSEEDPVALVVFDAESGWTISRGDRAAPVVDGDVAEVGGERWVIGLPEAIEGTIEARKSEHTIDDVALSFAVSGDEEYVELTAVVGGKAHLLKPRAYHYTLLLLARARMADAAEGVGDREQGWLYTSDLAQMLRASHNQIYVGLHRARKELDKLEVRGAASLVEKRTTTRQVRLGVADISEAPL